MSHSRDRQPTADECIVVGSGPSGMACAAALLESGARVTMIDVGRDLPSDRQARVSALSALGPTEWTPADRGWLTTPAPLAADGIPQKGLFGDLFMYADAPAAPPGFALRASEALGGLSRVWGATLARLVAEDLAGWPLTPGDLADHYTAVERLVPASTPDLSPQAARILARLDAARPSLARLRASVAPSRLAISQDCRRCGMCLHGCPYDCIFSSARWVRSSRPGFELRAGIRALRVE
jgi:choline dehydrogenase-like flavoprotein